MEVATTRECLAIRGCYVYTLCTDFHRLGIDGKRKYHKYHQEEPGL